MLRRRMHEKGVPSIENVSMKVNNKQRIMRKKEKNRRTAMDDGKKSKTMKQRRRAQKGTLKNEVTNGRGEARATGIRRR